MLPIITKPANPYSLIPSDTETVPLDEKEDFYGRISQSSPLIGKWRLVFLFLTASLVVSFSANAVLLYQRFCVPWQLYDKLPSRIAGLSRNTGMTLVEQTDYVSTNRTIQDAAWNQPKLNSYSLYIALDEDYAISKDLPHSQRWPWDHGKGVYILYAAHEIHCVHVIRSVLNDLYDGIPEADRYWQYPHAIHCLDVLRASIMCNADDWAMYTGRVHANAHEVHPFTGNGMVKQCRDWDALMDWANRHSACYQGVHHNDPSYEFERYKFCPSGERPWESSKSPN